MRTTFGTENFQIFKFQIFKSLEIQNAKHEIKKSKHMQDVKPILTEADDSMEATLLFLDEALDVISHSVSYMQVYSQYLYQYNLVSVFQNFLENPKRNAR
jgi:hypothetical protein